MAKKYTVMILDDEKKLLTVAQKMLKHESYELITTEKVEEALDLFEDKGPISVLVSDNRMPEMRGTEFLSKIKVYSPDTIRILMTAYYDPQLVEEVVNKGEAFRYLKKPLDFGVVKETINEGLAQYKKNLQVKALGQNVNRLDEEKSQLEYEVDTHKDTIASLGKRIKTILMGFVLMGCLYSAYQFGAEWVHMSALESTSEKIGPWFKYEDGTTLDTRTGLMWMALDYRNIEGRHPKNWQAAMDWADIINKRRFAGYTDWRVPTIEEYKVTFDPHKTRLAYDKKKSYPVGYPRVFENGGGYGYWSSDQYGLDSAKYFFFVGGYSKTENKLFSNNIMSVRLVRKN